MAKDAPPVILATPLNYPKASKALSNVVTSLPPEKTAAFYDDLNRTFQKYGKDATIAQLPEKLRRAVVLYYPKDTTP